MNVLQILGALSLFVTTLVAGDDTKPVHQKFIPVLSLDGNGASYSMLHPFPSEDSKVLAVQAHAGIGDKFPVKEENKPALFDVALVEGDDSQVTLEIRAAQGAQKLKLRRDQMAEATVGNVKYRFLFPDLSVNPSSGALTSHQVMLIVERDR